MAKILYVEDDSALAEATQNWLIEQGHVVEVVHDAEDALQLIRNYTYEVILLDWDLPGMSGMQFCREYRHLDGNAWIIFITGHDDMASLEEAFNDGADDYLSKPFSTRELKSRLLAALRRIDTSFEPSLTIGDITLDPENRKLTVAGKEISLMPKESSLLEYLLRHPDRMLSSKQLLAALWSSESDGGEGVVRTCVRQLRIKLEKMERADLIESIPSGGYVIRSSYGAKGAS